MVITPPRVLYETWKEHVFLDLNEEVMCWCKVCNRFFMKTCLYWQQSALTHLGTPEPYVCMEQPKFGTYCSLWSYNTWQKMVRHVLWQLPLNTREFTYQYFFNLSPGKLGLLIKIWNEIGDPGSIGSPKMLYHNVPYL